MSSSVQLCKRSLPRLTVAAVILAVAGVVSVRGDDRVLSGRVSIALYPAGVAMVQVPFRRDADSRTVSVAVDLDDDGAFAVSEEVLRDVPVTPRKYWNANLFFRPPHVLAGQVRVRVTSGGEVLDRSVHVTFPGDGLRESDFTDVTRPLESMTADMPDLSQRESECAPAAAADSLIVLAKRRGQDGRLPADTMKMLDELKDEMRWNPDDGVLPGAYLDGIARWSLAKGLPIASERVASFDDIRPALDRGAVAELRLQFIGANGPVGGHLVAVGSVTARDGRTFIAIHDPRSPSGTDVYEVIDGNIDYALYGGTTRPGIGFVHYWTGL